LASAQFTVGFPQLGFNSYFGLLLPIIYQLTLPETVLQTPWYPVKKNERKPRTLITQLKALPSLIQLIIGAALFTATYLTAAILTKTFNTQDINNLRGMSPPLFHSNHSSTKS
jgi:hypothetical protein